MRPWQKHLTKVSVCSNQNHISVWSSDVCPTTMLCWRIIRESILTMCICMPRRWPSTLRAFGINGLTIYGCHLSYKLSECIRYTSVKYICTAGEVQASHPQSAQCWFQTHNCSKIMLLTFATGRCRCVLYQFDSSPGGGSGGGSYSSTRQLFDPRHLSGPLPF